MGIVPTTGGYRSHEAEVEVVQGGIDLTRRNTDEVRWETLNEDEKEKVLKAVETEWKGVVRFTAMTIISPEEASNIRHQKQPKVISSRLVLHW